MSRAIHFAGGAATPSGKRGIRHALPGWPCCVSGHRAIVIARTGAQTWDEAEVTCARCLAFMAKRVDPGKGAAG